MDDSTHARMRHEMVSHQIIRRGIIDQRVIAALEEVPRQLFVPEHLRSRAYDDCPLPIAENQTISQPYVVALMTQALDLKAADRVLEIGTGSGYQTAILSRLAGQIYTIERHDVLAAQASAVFTQLGCANILSLVGDGTVGWPEHAPYDAILLTACGPDVPPPLVEQLALGGRLVAPVGEEGRQELVRVEKGQTGAISRKYFGWVSFLPLVGKHGWPAGR